MAVFSYIWHQMRGNLPLVLGAAILGTIVISALFAPWLGTVDPMAIAPGSRLSPPNSTHWFGTDRVGRDLYSRVLYGGRVSLLVGLVVAAGAGIIGLIVGVLASFVRRLDGVIMRFMDGLMSIPTILFAIALMALTGPSLKNVLIVITVTEVPRVARLVRSFVLSLREQAFVEAAITMDTSLPMLVWRHVLPNILSPLLVQLTFVAASAMMMEAMLGFLGAGLPTDTPSWGNIIADGQMMFQIRPSLILFPGLFLTLTVLSVNLLGRGLGRIVESGERRR